VLNLTHNSMTDYMFQEFLTAKSNRTANREPSVRWFDGSMVRWFDGSMVRWFDGSMVRWFAVEEVFTGSPGFTLLYLDNS
jgi:hypothetical protein